jgi:transcriptional regulator with XRE-family HTH domain
MATNSRQEPTRPDESDIVRRQFARKLEELLIARSWNQSELGRAAGLGRDAISTYIRGRCLPEPGNLKKIADALNTTPTQLIPQIVHVEEAELPEFEMSSIAGGRMRVRLDKEFTSDRAMRIAALVQEQNKENEAKFPKV